MTADIQTNRQADRNTVGLHVLHTHAKGKVTDVNINISLYLVDNVVCLSVLFSDSVLFA